MRKSRVLSISRITLLLLLGTLTLAVGSGSALAAEESALTGQIDPSSTGSYSGFTPYEEIQGVLDEAVATSDRVRYEVMGHSVGGRELYLVIVARPEVLAHLDRQADFRDLMLADPAEAQRQLVAGLDVKAPVFINCSIHGNEPNGVDAGLRLIDRLAYADLATDAEAATILDNCIVLLNICQNPDGRVADTRGNANGFDMNRDFLTASQPEVRATVAQIVRWLSMQLFDLHGYYSPMRIEPCTGPHNPNHEYDLFIKWALPDSLAMEDALKAETSRPVCIPYLDLKQGFDDYSPHLHAPVRHVLRLRREDDRDVRRERRRHRRRLLGLLGGPPLRGAPQGGDAPRPDRVLPPGRHRLPAARHHVPLRLRDPRRPAAAEGAAAGGAHCRSARVGRHRGRPGDHAVSIRSSSRPAPTSYPCTSPCRRWRIPGCGMARTSRT
jgi:hypothetical protein